MTAAKRELAIQDVAAIVAFASEADDPNVIYRAVERIAAEAIGWRLFTILRYIEVGAGRRASLLERREGLSGWRPQATQQDHGESRCHGEG